MDVAAGKATRRSNVNAAAPNRVPGVAVGYLVDWQEPALTPAATAWTEQAWARVYPYTQGTYVNMLGDESPERVREAYGKNYSRLAMLNAKDDSKNVCRLYQNILPS
jgi:hypothetical protein